MDTIVALATPAGNSGVAVIRVSGEKSLALLKKITHENIDFEPRKMYLKNVYLDNVTDKCLVVFFASPFSYTGEDVIVHLPDEDVTVEYGKVYDIFENNKSWS